MLDLNETMNVWMLVDGIVPSIGFVGRNFMNDPLSQNM